MLGKLLAQRNAATNGRYTHLPADPMRQAAEAIGQRIKAALGREAGAEVVALPTKRGAG